MTGKLYQFVHIFQQQKFWRGLNEIWYECNATGDQFGFDIFSVLFAMISASLSPSMVCPQVADGGTAPI